MTLVKALGRAMSITESRTMMSDTEAGPQTMIDAADILRRMRSDPEVLAAMAEALHRALMRQGYDRHFSSLGEEHTRTDGLGMSREILTALLGEPS